MKPWTYTETTYTFQQVEALAEDLKTGTICEAIGKIKLDSGAPFEFWLDLAEKLKYGGLTAQSFWDSHRDSVTTGWVTNK